MPVPLRRALRRFAKFMAISSLATLALAGCEGEQAHVPAASKPAASAANAGHFDAALHGAIGYPTRIAFGGDGSVFVSDVKAGAVFGYHGGRRTLQLSGLERPLGVAVAGDLLLVGSQGRASVDAYDTVRGTWLRSLGAFKMPNAIAVAGNGDVAVVDSATDTVRVFGPAPLFKPRFTLGGTGSSNGLFRFPVAVAIDGSRMAIADQGNHRVQVFDRDGRWIFAFGHAIPAEATSRAQMRGGMTRIQGIAFAGDTIAVLDAYHSHVQVFDSQGNTLRWLGRGGDCAGCIGLGLDLAADATGRLWVTDPERGRWLALDAQEEVQP